MIADAPVHVRRATPLVLTGYLVAALAVTWSWWTPLGGRISAVIEPDAVLFSWLLSVTPHALAEGRFPLSSDLLNHPSGINLMGNNGMALPGLLLAPVTYAFGGVAAVTVATTIGLAPPRRRRTCACAGSPSGWCRPRSAERCSASRRRWPRSRSAIPIWC